MTTRNVGSGLQLLLATFLAAPFCGCGAPEAQFQTNLVYIAKQRQSGAVAEETVDNLNNVMFSLFGTPDNPHVPSGMGLENVLDTGKLQMAAGPVRRDEAGRTTGLYREHCAHCHGVTGNGRGPTASFLNPYPRDYRRGIFKFKSTPGNDPPATPDLERILYDGIAGTSMPSFKLIDSDQREALQQYVQYLAIRGEVERALISFAAADMEEGEMYVSVDGESDYRDVILDEVKKVVGKWTSADAAQTPVPQRPEMTEQQLAESVDRGRVLFHGVVANCSKCHGETALGDGVQTDYDEWTKELEPKDEERVAEYMELGALKPRNIIPRNLRMNVFRGGRRPIDIYHRIINGIAGSGMPAAAMLGPGEAPTDKKLTTDQVWDIVNYVRNLPYEYASEPPQRQPAYRRDRL